MAEMGLPNVCPDADWREKGYITIIRRLWHILPYSQLLELLEMDEQRFALTLKEDDFLDIKLGEKPDCDRVIYRELTEKEKERTAEIRKIMTSVDLSGKKPFDFEYQVPNIKFSGKPIFDTRMIYAFSGLYQNAFEVDSESFCPDEQLKAYSALGINGIWTQGVLSQLAEFPFEPSISNGYKKRLERMKEFTERLDKYGIKLFLYINEPRYMPIEFFEKHPDIQGHVMGNNACLCTSTDTVRDYLKNAIEEICRAVPLIGGFFTITRSENLTNCYSHSARKGIECNCPRCSKLTVANVISDTIECFCEGAHRVDPNIKVFAWNWAWGEYAEDIIRSLPEDVILISQSELDVPYEIGGVKGRVIDYSMSITGPGQNARSLWKAARERGLQIGAKVQVNTTWEASTVPAIPVLPSIEKHIRDLKHEGVQHLLLSWTLGGYPSANIAAAAKHFYEECNYNIECSPYYAAELRFSEAFKEFPFHLRVLYCGPQNAGPSTLLFESPTGYNATMTCYAYDDLEKWRGNYPIDVLEDQFKKLCDGWNEGLALLPSDDTSETVIMAQASYCLFKSSLNQIRFNRARNDGRYADAATAAAEELCISEKMLSLMNRNAAIGYEAANHYYFSKGQMAEKLINCHYVIDKMKEKI